MPAIVSLQSIVDALQMQSDEVATYLNLDTGELLPVTEEDRSLVESDEELDDLPDWQKEELPKIRAALDSDRWVELPDRFEVHEWRIMERFAQDQQEPHRGKLITAIHGSGAFRSFKSYIHRAGIEQHWYRFRDTALEQIARDWLEEQKVSYR